MPEMVDDTWAEIGSPTYPVSLGDTCGGPIAPWCEVEEGNKGEAFEKHWGARK